MKKFLTVILALALVASMPVTAFAAEPDATLTGDRNSQSIDVKVTYQDATSTPTVYSVDVEWEEMTFTYAASGAKVWNPSTHQYQESTSGGWTKDSAGIKVTNHSNAAVDVAVSYTASGTTGVTGTITNGSFTLESAEGKAVTAADSKTATLKVSGVPEERTAANLKVGTVTVSFE